MTPQQAYKKNAQSARTRIEMLLAIYDSTISTIDAGIQNLQSEDRSGYPSLQLRVSELCLLLISGLDTQSTLGARIRDLCIFCIDQTSHAEVQGWESARSVLNTLREGFLEIREEGNRLESCGEIPRLSEVPEHTLVLA
ncbi:hypothetical protein SH668x_000814 [Planctomicrobium sp. SH668]|uniref:hypothetical protein n=1 Tax=Planctomicrobium sp. SH668 TaxID=3448126 RepID=UPI003F5C35A1